MESEAESCLQRSISRIGPEKTFSRFAVIPRGSRSISRTTFPPGAESGDPDHHLSGRTQDVDAGAAGHGSSRPAARNMQSETMLDRDRV